MDQAEYAIYRAIDLAELFKMTVIQSIKGEESKLIFYVIAGDLTKAVETMNLSIEEFEQALPDTRMILLKVSSVGDGIRIAPAIVSRITSG